MGVSKNNGTPKSSILIGFSIINHPFWGTPIFGNTHVKSHDQLKGANVRECSAITDQMCQEVVDNLWGCEPTLLGTITYPPFKGILSDMGVTWDPYKWPYK